MLEVPCLMQEVLLTSAEGTPQHEQAKALLQGPSTSLFLSKLCQCLEESARAAPPSGTSLGVCKPTAVATHMDGRQYVFHIAHPIKCPSLLIWGHEHEGVYFTSQC